MSQWVRSQTPPNDNGPEKIQVVTANGSGTGASGAVLAKDTNHEVVAEVATLSPPIGQFVISTILNIAGIAAAVAFGVFAVRSVALAAEANTQSRISNQMALTSFCLTSNNVSSQLARLKLVSCHSPFGGVQLESEHSMILGANLQ